MKYALDKMLPLRAFQRRGTPIGGRGLRLYGDGGYTSSDYDPNWLANTFPEPAPAADAAPAENAPIYVSPGFIDTSSGGPPTPVLANQWQQTVNDIYQQTFGRQADPSGMASFTAALNAGLTGEQMREALRTSAEGQSYGLSPDMGGGNANTTDEWITGHDSFGMPMFIQNPKYVNPNAGWEWQPPQATDSGTSQAYWQNTNTGERRDLATPVNIRTVRDEAGNVSYVNADTGEAIDTKKFDKSITGYNTEVRNLYKDLLGREPDKAEVATYDKQLKDGSLTLSDLTKGFTTSEEYLNKVMPFLDPNADVNTKFEQGVRGFDAKGLTRGGALDGLPTHYFDPKTGKLAAWFGTNSGETATDFYTWHTANELKVPGSEMRLAEESKRDVGAEWRYMGASALKLGATLAGAYLAGPAAGLAEAGTAAASSAVFTTGSALADAALKSAAMNALTTVASGGSATDVLKSGLIGAVSGAAGSAIGGINGGEGLGSFGNALAKAGVQTGLTALTGGNVPNALIASAISTALPMALDTVIPKGMFDSLPDVIKNSIVNTASRALTAAATGGDVSDAALKSILSIASNTAKAYASGDRNVSDKDAELLMKYDLLPAYMQTPASISNADLADQIQKDVSSRNDFGSTPSRDDVVNSVFQQDAQDVMNRNMPPPLVQAAIDQNTPRTADNVVIPPLIQQATGQSDPNAIYNQLVANAANSTVGAPSEPFATGFTRNDADPLGSITGGNLPYVKTPEDEVFGIPVDENGIPLPPSVMDKIRNIHESQDYLYQTDQELKSSAAELFKQYYPDQPYTTFKDGVEINQDGTPVKQYGSAVPIVDAQGNLVRHEGEMRPAEPSMAKQLIGLVASTDFGRSQLGNLNTAANMIPGFGEWAARLVGRAGQIADDTAQDNPDTATTKADKEKLYEYIREAAAPATNFIQKYSGISPTDPAFNSGTFTTAMTLYGDAMHGLAKTISSATGFDVQDVEDVINLAVPSAVQGAAKGVSGAQSAVRNTVATVAEAYHNSRNEIGGREVYNPSSGKFESIADPAEVVGRAAAGVVNTIFGPREIAPNLPAVGTTLLEGQPAPRSVGALPNAAEVARIGYTPETPALGYTPTTAAALPVEPRTISPDVANTFNNAFAAADRIPTYDVSPQPATQLAPESRGALPTTFAEAPAINLGPYVNETTAANIVAEGRTLDQAVSRGLTPEVQAQAKSYVDNTYTQVADKPPSSIASAFFDSIFFSGAGSEKTTKAISDTVNNPAAPPEVILEQVDKATQDIKNLDEQLSAKLAMLSNAEKLGITPGEAIQLGLLDNSGRKTELGEKVLPTTKPQPKPQPKPYPDPVVPVRPVKPVLPIKPVLPPIIKPPIINPPPIVNPPPPIINPPIDNPPIDNPPIDIPPIDINPPTIKPPPLVKAAITPPKVAAPAAAMTPSYMYSGAGSQGTTIGALPGNLQATFLQGANVDEYNPFENYNVYQQLGSPPPIRAAQGGSPLQLAQMQKGISGIDPSLYSVLQKRAAPSYFTYGEDTSGGNPTTFAGSQMMGKPMPGIPVIPTGQKAGADWLYQGSGTNPLAMAGTGIPSLPGGMMAHGGQAHGGEGEHIPEFITGATGHYVRGRGDGQSDDIPAMLADGEYVFDASTVSTLGNGSSDAGAKLLDAFRESLRDHTRSAPADKIPPKASPLEYMKEALQHVGRK